MDYGDFEDLAVEVQDGIGHFRITRPEKLNALRTRTFHEVIELGRRFQADGDVRVVVCTHEGRGFSSGADLSDRGGGELPGGARLDESMGVSAVGLAMPSIEKPTIASVNGVAAGAGMAFACSFDVRFVGPGTRFITVFARRALAPDCGLTYFLPRLVGPARALELLYSAREVGAEEAVRIGLGNELADDPDARAFELARQLAAGPPLSYLWAKRDIQHTWDAALQEQIEFEWTGQRAIGGSEDVREGRAAFLEQREPRFSGR